MPGPPRTPTPILKARGSWRAKDREPEPSYPLGAPPCPATLPAAGKTEWKRVVALMVSAGVMQQTDRAVLAAYCRCWAEWVRVSAIVGAEDFDYMDEGNRKLSRLLSSLEDRLCRYAQQYGFTPASRSRVQAGDVPAAADTRESKFFGKGADKCS